MTLGSVYDLVPQRAGELRFVSHSLQRGTGDKDKASGQGKRSYDIGIEDPEPVRKLPGSILRNGLADQVHIPYQLGCVDNTEHGNHLGGGGFADLLFLLR